VLACVSLALTLTLPRSAAAEPPPWERQLVYAVEAFDGLGYASTFAPASEDTIYLLADEDNALSPRFTMVYYWPLSRRYRADWKALNEPVEAESLEILSDQRVIQTLSPTSFSLVFPKGYSSRVSELCWGAEAEERYADFLKRREEHRRQMLEYRNAMREYHRAFAEYISAMLDEKVVEKPPAPTPPEEPPPFLLVVTPPTRGFIVNLPEGSYSIRLRGTEGQVIPDSEKRLVVFSHRRKGVGYNIIPESRWTKPERSDDPQDTIYVGGKGNAALYLQPFLEAEFNEARYLGLLDPQDHSGSEDRWLWVHLEPYSSVVMAVFDSAGGQEIARVEERPYYVVQLPERSLGYRVVEHQPEEVGDERPTFRAFKLSLTGQEERLLIRLLDARGRAVEGSQREIRRLPDAFSPLLGLWLCAPLLAGLASFLWRRSRLRRMAKVGTT